MKLSPSSDEKLNFHTAWLCYKAGDFKDAIENFSKLIEKDSQNQSAIWLRGLSYFESSNYNAAIDDFNKVDEASPFNHQMATEKRGNAYLNLGDYEHAVDELSESIKIDGLNAELFRRRAEAYKHLGKDEEAKFDNAVAESLNQRK
jgi:tetratricopeptide (TPR) repeat protein